jgi:hypothetical protein
MAHAAEDTIYISMCSGGAMVKVNAAERPQFILGQIIILGVAMVVTLVELDPAEPDKNAAQAVTPGGAGSHPVLRGSSGTSNPPQANPPYCPSRNELIFQ